MGGDGEERVDNDGINNVGNMRRRNITESSEKKGGIYFS